MDGEKSLEMISPELLDRIEKAAISAAGRRSRVEDNQRPITAAPF